MSGIKMARLFGLLMAIAAIGFSGCILSPDEEVPPDKPVVVYRDLTNKEDVVYNLVQCYNEANHARYQELLHEQYRWHNQDLDVRDLGLEEFNARDQEITTHEKMFRAAKRQYNEDPMKNLDDLELIIQDGQWGQIPDIEGVLCEDCWETTRIYTITIKFAEQDKTIIGDDLVRFVVMGVPEGETTYYRLIRAYDIKD